MLFFVCRRASLLVLERAEHRLLALDAHENAEDRRRDDDVGRRPVGGRRRSVASSFASLSFYE